MTALATRTSPPTALASIPISDGMSMQDIAKACAASGFFKDSRDAAQAIVKIQAGHELGIPPIAAMTGIYIVEGKVSIGAVVMGACVQRSGRFGYRVRKFTNEECQIEFFQGSESLGLSGWTIADATRAGLAGRDTYRKYPKAMLRNRAMADGVRTYCPGVFGGPVYTPDEVGVDIDADGNPAATEPRPAFDQAKTSAVGGVSALNAAITGTKDCTAKDPDPFVTEPVPGEESIRVVAATPADVVEQSNRAPTTAEKVQFANTLRKWSGLNKSEDGDACRRFAAKHGLDIGKATSGDLDRLHAAIITYTSEGTDWFAVMNKPDPSA